MNNSEFVDILQSLRPISLSEMESVMLMYRYETKYIFSANKIPKILKLMSDNYKALEINNIREFPYHTTYLDTPELMFYYQQITGKLNRHKVRYRKYESTGVSFLEIKKKTNRYRTIKWRIENYYNSISPDESAFAFIKEYLPYSSLELKPVLINKFTRLTLAGDTSSERITLDYNISFQSNDRLLCLPFMAIAELKKDVYSNMTPFGVIMKQMGIHPGSFSKYAVGSALTKDLPRNNILKPKFLLINRIENEYNNSRRA